MSTTNKKHISTGEKSITYNESESFINIFNSNQNQYNIYTNKKCTYIKSYPTSGDESFSAYNGYPLYIRGKENFGKQFDNIIKDLLDNTKNYIIILSLQITNEGDKHAFLIYFDKKYNRLELFDSNGSNSNSHGKNTKSFLKNMKDYLETELNKTTTQKIKIINYDENINILDTGHCDALSLFYAILRKESYKKAQSLFLINWKKPKNIKLLNYYIRKKKISSLQKLVNFDLNFI
tara:strand:+ start:375 stop:1079 length:705 start_codon:yes stop_codon:yes gene_type:complete